MLVGLCVLRLACLFVVVVGAGVGLYFVLGVNYYLRARWCRISIWVFGMCFLFIQTCIQGAILN